MHSDPFRAPFAKPVEDKEDRLLTQASTHLAGSAAICLTPVSAAATSTAAFSSEERGDSDLAAGPPSPVQRAGVLVQDEPEFAAAWKWVAPLLLYMVLPLGLEKFGLVSTSGREYLEPRPPQVDWGWLGVVVLQVGLTAAWLVWLLPNYWRALPFRVSGWAIPLGLAGLLLWVGVCQLQLEAGVLALVPGAQDWAARPGIDPSQSFPETWPYIVFLLFRFTGLVLVVPLAEELLLRGYLLRMLQRDDWWRMPMRQLSWVSIGLAGLYGAVSHPNEAVAAVLWFAAVTWWVRYSDRFWDGVVIHAVTNAALGWYVLTYSQWHLW